MFYFDPLYLLVLGITIGLGALTSMLVKSTFAKYSRFGTQRRMTGAQVAREILRRNDIYDVKVERVAGTLSDHYDPRGRVLRLSQPVYDSESMAAVGVAAHEVGHAIQHAHGYAPLQFRSMWVPMAGIGSNLGWFVIIAALMLGGGHGGTLATTLAWVGVGLFGCTTLFTLITLPVEFDASRRALIQLDEGGFVTEDELRGSRKVLNAAALTYVAAAVSSLLMLLYYAYRLGLIGGRRD